jgi:uncharacterized protein YndB with AHSA1/START domain
MPSFAFDRTYDFDADAAALWDAFSDIAAYRRWWPWLRSIEGDGLVAGGVTRAVIWAPVPWLVHIRLTVLRLEPGRRVDVEVGGDFTGPASMEIAEAAAGASVRLMWQLTPAAAPLRLAARVARPLMQAGQDWVVSAGLGQFRRRALPG